MSAAELSHEPWTGKPMRRLEDRGMLTGAMRYVTDLRLPGMLELAFVRSDQPHARITAIDAERARAVSGVRVVLTSEDTAHLTPTVDTVRLEESLKTPRPTLPGDVVRYVGEPIVAVVAEDRYVAEDAAALVTVRYDPIDGAPLHAHIPDSVPYGRAMSFGEVDAAFQGAPHVFRRRLSVQRVVTTAMETCGAVADFDAGTGELTLYVSTQMPHVSRLDLAMALGMPVSHVRVVCPAMGGAFGGKENMLPEYLCAAVASIALGVPVRWVEDRREALIAGSQAKEAECELETAMSADGDLLAMRSRFRSDSGAYVSGIGAYVEFIVAAHTVPGLYALPAYAYEASAVLTSKAPLSAYRGVGMTVSQLVREVALDEAARGAGIDRMELRRRNMIADGPWRNVMGEEYEPGSWRSAFTRALELIDYEGFLDVQRAARGEGRLLGLGVSPFVESGAFGHTDTIGGLPHTSNDSATVSLDISGNFTVAVPTFSFGQGHHTTTAQLVADLFSVEPQRVRVLDGDTARTPFGMGTYGSRSGVYLAGSVTRAALALREKVLTVAGILLHTPAAALELADGGVRIAGHPEAFIPLPQIAGAALFAPIVRREMGDPSLTASAFFEPPGPTHSNGAIAVQVDVDAETGAVRIDRIVVVEDCGRIINPMIVDGQIRGGVAQGVGVALTERFLYDEAGQPLTTSMKDYQLPRSIDLPAIEIEHMTTSNEASPAGVKGMAEGAAMSTPAAVVCAVLDAIAPFGEAIVQLPLRPESIVAALSGVGDRPAGVVRGAQ